MTAQLAKKLQVRAGRTSRVFNAPRSVEVKGLGTTGRGPFDVVLLFAVDQSQLHKHGEQALGVLSDGGILWVAYPKKTSALASDLDRDHGWEPLTDVGFDPVSQVAVDETWSALRWKRDPALRAKRIARGSVLAPKKKKTATLKTAPTGGKVDAFLAGLDAARRDEARALVALMSKRVKAPATLWGSSIVGFGNVHLTYESGRELDWFRCGFAVRAKAIALYGLQPSDDSTKRLLAKLGPHEAKGGCVLLKALDQVDRGVLTQLIDRTRA